MAPTSKSAATGDKKKSKRSSRPSAEATSRSKDKDRKSKDKDRKSSSRREKEKAATAARPPPEPAAVAAPVTTPPPPLVHDPDAIQLFRRYDRNRSGVLTRLDFLQLLRDYADPTTGGWGASLSRPPLSLTDTRGIPLGYQRAEKNSEFEAGQLFERYDKDHTGALTLDTFHVFFADFKPQLRAFAEESNYRALAPPPATVAPVPVPVPVPTEVRDAAAGDDTPPPSPKMIRARYRAALWKLRKICKEELVGQRERVVQQIKAIRDDMASRERDSRDKRRQRSSPFPDFDDDNTRDEGGLNGAGDHETAKQNESMEEDLAQLDEIIRYVRRYLNKGHDVSRREMEAFIEQADRIEDEAQCLAMKDYGIVEQHVTFKKEKENEPPAAPTSTSASVQPSSLPPTQYQKQTDLGSLLRVKDQMIYQLLQERTAMRKERAAVEASLKKLSDVSTREMKKWARLTDDMQAEIEQLRSQLLVVQSQQRNAMT
ncbi:EF-hand domain pair [Phytophthora cinnamomi]|uniref:EF-hand domain pair n=1 Tax=Phytophthora cinnamomi TaxID=4785 RepID=UPI00355AA4CD|nr:EF-hand domain pair [Phytophthora cinnamomi]